MAQQCEYLEGCPMFKYFRANARIIFLNVYCEGYYDQCKRRQLRLAGKPVPDTLLPHGGTLWKEKPNGP